MFHFNRLPLRVPIKNYYTVCAYLGVEPLKGDSRLAQIRIWKQYMDWINIGHKWIIIEIYDIPKPKQDMRYVNQKQQRDYRF